MFVTLLALSVLPVNSVLATKNLDEQRGNHAMHVIGYARVSTTDQDLTIQREQLTAVGCTKLFEEKESGAKGDRPQLAAMLAYVRHGDTLVITKLDRLARSMVHFWSI